MAFDLLRFFSTTPDEITKIVEDEIPHPDYKETCERAAVMNSWYKAEDDTYLKGATGTSDKSDIIKRSNVESDDEYDIKLKRMKLFPLERKFFAAQQRIYDENNVQRVFPEASKEFWEKKLRHFDDNGDSVNTYFKDKALFVKEELGFGASMVDIVTSDSGRTVTDTGGKPIPYSYTIRPHELYNFRISQGVLVMLVTRQTVPTLDEEEKTIWRAFTSDKVYRWTQIDGGDKVKGKTINNPFPRIPASILKGDIDQDSGFRVGKPRRYSLKGLYLAASELFYDLQQGGLLFGHPIPFLPISIVKQMAGIEDKNDKIDRETIKNKVGMLGIYPDGMEPPKSLFWQADMSGLEFLKSTIFDNLMELIFQLASVRDKSRIAHNASGRAKEFDHIDEQGLLAQTAIEMEGVERDQFELMAAVRGESFSDFTINYTKHHDLSSAAEIFADMTEAAQYDIKDQGLWEYWVTEYMRKRSAPTEMQGKAALQAAQIGRPLTEKEFTALDGKLSDMELLVKMRPELLNESREAFLDNIKQIRNDISPAA